VTLAATSPGGICMLVTDADNVYWIDTVSTPGPGGNGVQYSSALHKVALDGGQATALASNLDVIAGSPLALDSSAVYFAAIDNGIMAVPIAGGSATTLGPGTALSTLVGLRGAALYALGAPTVTDIDLLTAPVTGTSPSNLSSFDGGMIPVGAAIDANNAYWSWTDEQNSSGIFVAPLDGGTSTTSIPTGSPNRFLAVDGTYVYYPDTNGGAGVLRSAPLDGGPPTTLVSGLTFGAEEGNVVPLAVDSTSIYWSEGSCGSSDGGCAFSVMKAPLAGGGTPVVLATFDEGVQQIAVDATSVYAITCGASAAGESSSPGYVAKITPK
jgi:hypothetical protein